MTKIYKAILYLLILASIGLAVAFPTFAIAKNNKNNFNTEFIDVNKDDNTVNDKDNSLENKYVGKDNTEQTIKPQIKPVGECKSFYIIENTTGAVLKAQNENEMYPIASMVKIMTLLIAFEQIEEGKLSMDEMIVISHNSAIQTGSELFIDEREKYSVADLLKGIIVVSANDASVAIAERIANSEEGFVTIMNEKAKEIGLQNTLYSNCTGLPSTSAQYSTAKDVTILTRKLISFEKYKKFSQIWLEDYKHPSGRITQLSNTNKLIRHYTGCDSGKTGYTDSARFCLSASAERNNMRAIATVIGAESSKERFRKTSELFNFAFSNFKVDNIHNANSLIANEIKVNKGKLQNIEIISKQNIGILKGTNNKELTRIVIDLPTTIKAPIAKGDIIGYAKIYFEEKEIDSIPLISNIDIAKAKFSDYIKKITIKW